MKKSLLTILLTLLLSSCNSVIESEKLENHLSPENRILEGEPDVGSRDKAIEEYLLSERAFSWEESVFAKRVCLFENL